MNIFLSLFINLLLYVPYHSYLRLFMASSLMLGASGGSGAIKMTYVNMAGVGGDWQESVEPADRALIHQLLTTLQYLSESRRPRLESEPETDTEFEIERNDAQRYYTLKVLYPSYNKLSFSQQSELYRIGMSYVDPDYFETTTSPPDGGHLVTMRVQFHDRPIAQSTKRITIETQVMVVPVKVRAVNDDMARSGDKRARTSFIPDVNATAGGLKTLTSNPFSY